MLPIGDTWGAAEVRQRIGLQDAAQDDAGHRQGTGQQAQGGGWQHIHERRVWKASKREAGRCLMLTRCMLWGAAIVLTLYSHGVKL